MNWEKPAYREVSMSAEIGGYQDDFDERAPKPDETIRTGDASRAIPTVG